MGLLLVFVLDFYQILCSIICSRKKNKIGMETREWIRLDNIFTIMMVFVRE